MVKILIRKWNSINRVPTSPIISSDIPSLNHKPWDDPVKLHALIVELITLSITSLLTCAQSPKIFASLRHVVKQFYGDPPRCFHPWWFDLDIYPHIWEHAFPVTTIQKWVSRDCGRLPLSESLLQGFISIFRGLNMVNPSSHCIPVFLAVEILNSEL